MPGWRRCLTAVTLLAGLTASAASGQTADPFVPLGSRLDRLVSWAQDAGAFAATLDPLVRPLRLSAVAHALAAEDTTRLDAAGRRAVRDVAAEVARASGDRALALELDMSGYRNGRRDSFRPGGAAGAGPAGGVWGMLSDGSFVAVVNPAFDNRLRDDPEFTGYVRPEIVGRMQTAYLAVAGRHATLAFGRMSRNWGPSLFEGLLVSPSAYATDELSGSLTIGRFTLLSIAKRLNDDTALMGTPTNPFNRYFFAHRLGIRAGRTLWLDFTEAGIYGGQGQSWEPALSAPLDLALLSEFNERLHVNSLLGLDAAWQTGRVNLTASGMLDDIQVDRGTLTDRRPAAYGFTVVARTAVPDRPLHVALGYTRVSSLAYRNSVQPSFVYAEAGVGLARNYSDYDQWLARLEWRPTPDWYAAFDVQVTRQGAGDFRQPFPTDSVLALPGEGFLMAPVSHLAGVRLTVVGTVAPGVEVRGETGTTTGLNGKAAAILSGTVAVTLDALTGRFGSPWRGVEAGALREWP